jgi:hypothetical protein
MSLTGITPIMIVSMMELRLASLKETLEDARKLGKKRWAKEIHNEIMILMASIEEMGTDAD